MSQFYSTSLICLAALLWTTTALSYDGRDLDVLKKTIWLEARGEPYEGKVAVGHVIVSRAKANRGYWGGGKVADVCLHPRQFEPWNNQRPEDVHPAGDGYEDMDGWVRGVLDGNVADPTGGALYFNNPDKEGYPDWTRNVRKGVKIGNHQFYNEGGVSPPSQGTVVHLEPSITHSSGGTCSEGSLQGNSNPRKYEQCVYGRWMERDCPPGTVWDAATNNFRHAR